MSNTRLEPKLHFAEWMNKRGKETPKEQAIRMADNVQEALKLNPECKIGLLYSANMKQADALNRHYAYRHGDNVPEDILRHGHGQAELFQAFIRHINGHWTPTERARVRIVGISTSLRGGKDSPDNSLSESQILAVVNSVHNLMEKEGYVILGMERQGERKNKGDMNPEFNKFNIGGGVSANWTAEYVGLELKTRDAIFQKAMNPDGILIERAPEFCQPLNRRSMANAQGMSIEKFTEAYNKPKESFIKRHPRIALGLGIFVTLVAIALVVAATIATCGAAGIPLGFLGAGIAAAGATTITGGFSVFAAVAGGGFLLAALTGIGGALGIHWARKEIEMQRLASKPMLKEWGGSGASPAINEPIGGTHAELGSEMRAKPGQDRGVVVPEGQRSLTPPPEPTVVSVSEEKPPENRPQKKPGLN